MKKFLITTYMPSHKQLSLHEEITPEQITALVGQEKGPSSDGKCKHQWEFFAATYGASGKIVHPCSIWDYKEARWSAYGPQEVFIELGLLHDQK